MLTLALVSAGIAMMAALLGFGEIISAAAGAARVVFFVFLVIFQVTFLTALL